ncbi:hypothetical protein KAR91_69865 [Candidatus Pacearchaeota archaeon]|nr:hypothetical protein [Candidatus Pacearchaeota archaeon]
MIRDYDVYIANLRAHEKAMSDQRSLERNILIEKAKRGAYVSEFEGYCPMEAKLDPPGIMLGLTREIYSDEEGYIFNQLMEMSYEDMCNGALEAL